MKTGNLMTLPGAALAVALSLLLTQVPASAQDDAPSGQKGSAHRSAASRRIEGLWDVKVQLCNLPAPVGTFQALNTYAQGGTMTETGAGLLPVLRGPGLGTWQHLGGRRYSSGFRFFTLHADGRLKEMYNVTREIELGQGYDSYTATASLEIIPFNGIEFDHTQKQTGCATETAVRVE